MHMPEVQPLAQSCLRASMMNMKMQHVVKDVSRHEPRHDRQHVWRTERETQADKGSGHNWQTHQGRHHKPEWVRRMGVMNAVNQKLQSAANCGARNVVEEKAVAEIFHQGPDQIPRKQFSEHRSAREGGPAESGQHRYSRRVEDQGYEMMHPG